MSGANSLPPHVYGFSTARHFRSVPNPLVNHSLRVTASLYLALSQIVTNHLNEYTTFQSEALGFRFKAS